MMKWCENSVLVTLEENIMDMLLVATVCLLKKKKKHFHIFRTIMKALFHPILKFWKWLHWKITANCNEIHCTCFFLFFFPLMIQANNPAISCSGTVKLQSIGLNIFFILDKYLIFYLFFNKFWLCWGFNKIIILFCSWYFFSQFCFCFPIILSFVISQN